MITQHSAPPEAELSAHILTFAAAPQWEQSGGTVETPLSQLAEGVATISITARGHLDGMIRVLVEKGKSENEPTAIPTALKLKPAIAAGTFMAVLKWDGDGPAEQLDLYCLTSSGARCHRGEPPTDELFVEFSMSSRGGPQILQGRLHPQAAYTCAVHLHSHKEGAKADAAGSAAKGSDDARRTALSDSGATLVVYLHNQKPLKMRVPKGPTEAQHKGGIGGAISSFFGGGGGGSGSPTWWTCLTLRVTGQGAAAAEVEVETIDRIDDKPPGQPAAPPSEGSTRPQSAPHPGGLTSGTIKGNGD